MQPHYLFEFCDQPWVPAGARECLFEIMVMCNTGSRSFNAQVAKAAIQIARRAEIHTIVEVGAGRAPITQQLVQEERTSGFKFLVCDLMPNMEVFRNLEEQYPGRVQPVYESVDFTQPQTFFNGAVLVLSGVMHHIPFEKRPAAVRALSGSGSWILVCEPIKRTLLSMFLAYLAAYLAFVLPITHLHCPGRLRRLVWCWLLPIVPFMFAWDGVVSCLRQWNEREWRELLDRLSDLVRDVDIRVGFNSLRVVWSRP